MANIFSKRVATTNSIKYYLGALAIAKEIDTNRVGGLHYSLAQEYRAKMDRVNSLQHLRECLVVAKKTKNKELMLKVKDSVIPIKGKAIDSSLNNGMEYIFILTTFFMLYVILFCNEYRKPLEEVARTL